jgi:hypothetical protein
LPVTEVCIIWSAQKIGPSEKTNAQAQRLS